MGPLRGPLRLGSGGLFCRRGNASCSHPLFLDLFLLSLFAKEPEFLPSGLSLSLRCSSTPALRSGGRAQRGSPRPPAVVSATIPLCLSSCEVHTARSCRVLVASERGPTRTHGLGAAVFCAASLSSVIPACALKACTRTWVRAATSERDLILDLSLWRRCVSNPRQGSGDPSVWAPTLCSCRTSSLPSVQAFSRSASCLCSVPQPRSAPTWSVLGECSEPPSPF